MIIYSIFIIVGSLLLAAAIAGMKNRLAFLKKGERVEGTVVELEKREDEDGAFYYPVFEIYTSQRKKITYKHTGGSAFPTWKIGATRNFVFIPGKPETVWHLSYGKFFAWPLTLMVLGADLLVIGTGYFLLSGYFNG